MPQILTAVGQCGEIFAIHGENVSVSNRRDRDRCRYRFFFWGLRSRKKNENRTKMVVFVCGEVHFQSQTEETLLQSQTETYKKFIIVDIFLWRQGEKRLKLLLTILPSTKAFFLLKKHSLNSNCSSQTKIDHCNSFRSLWNFRHYNVYSDLEKQKALLWSPKTQSQ